MSDLRIDPRGVRLLLIAADEGHRAALVGALSAIGYGAIHAVSDPHEAVAASPDSSPDLILVDVDAPTSGGGDLVVTTRTLLERSAGPILGVTRAATPAERERAATADVQDLLVLPMPDAELTMRLGNALAAARLRRLLSDRSARLTEALRERTAEHDTLRESLSMFAAIADYHDDDTDQHAQRVGVAAAAIARTLKLPDDLVAMLRDAAPLHDIGKVGLSRRILLKPDKLTPSEWLHMQSHVDIGAGILASARSPVLVMAAEIARTHHERFDGSGYTAGLSGEQIPLSGRIVAVADVWDTLTHDRPYRKAWDPAKALDEILSQAGRHFDPRVVEAFSIIDPAELAPVETERVA